MTIPRVTAADILELLQEHPGRAFEATEIGYILNISYSAILPLVRKLADEGTIRRTPGKRKINMFHIGDLVQKAERAPVAPYVGEITPPFRTTCWTPPLQGYDSKLAVHATLAMLSRRA